MRCSVKGCRRKVHAQSLCHTHYEHARRYGHPLPARTPSGSGEYTSSGYLRITAAGHPLADGRGRAMAHRVVLYGVLGPGEQRCAYCGCPLRWEQRNRDAYDYLTVDHVDGHRLNNEPSNLVACCLPCNRSRQGKAFKRPA